MLFNLQNLPFLGHIRSLIEAIRCSRFVNYFESINPFRLIYNTTTGGFSEIVPTATVPKDVYSFLLTGLLRPDGSILLQWNFSNDYYSGLTEKIKFFKVSAVTANGNIPLTGLTNYQNYVSTDEVPFIGEYAAHYLVVKKFINDPLVEANKSNTFQVEAFGDIDGQCLLISSNLCIISLISSAIVSPPPPPLPPTPPPFPPPIITPPPPLPPPIPTGPTDCQNFSYRMLGTDVVVQNAQIDTTPLAIRDAFGVIIGYRDRMIVSFDLPPVLSSTNGPVYVQLELSTSSSGPFSNSYFYPISLRGTSSTTKTYSFDVSSIINWNRSNICFRLRSLYYAPVYRFNIQCVGCVAVPKRLSCATINQTAQVGNLQVAKRQLVTNIFGDPCGIYQYIEVVPPPEMSIATARWSMISSRLAGMRASYINDYDGTVNPGIFGDTNISPCPISQSYQFSPGITTSADCTSILSDRNAGLIAYSFAVNPRGSSLATSVSQGFAYKIVGGPLGTKVFATPGTIPILTKVADFRDPEITINSQPGIVSRNEISIAVVGEHFAPLGTAYYIDPVVRYYRCLTKSTSVYHIAPQTAQEINDFYNANKASKAASCLKTRAWAMRLRFRFFQDVHFLAIPEGGKLNKDAVLLLDDNSSSNLLNYFYLETDSGNAHLIKYKQKAVSDSLEPDWLNPNGSSCTPSSGFFIENIFYYTGSTGNLQLVGDKDTLDEQIVIENKFVFEFDEWTQLGSIGSSSQLSVERPLGINLSPVNYASNLEPVVVNGYSVLRPTALDVGTYFNGVSKIGGAYYHLVKKMGDYPTTSLPFFCYGEGVDGFNSFMGIPRSVFETGYLQETPDATKFFNYIEIMGGGTGSGIPGGNVYDPLQADCGQSLCFDPMISKRGMVKINTHVTSNMGKSFKGVMRASIADITNTGSPIPLTNFYFVKTGKSLNPEIDVTEAYFGKTGEILEDESNIGMAFICTGCNNSRLSGHAETGVFGIVNETILSDVSSHLFVPYSSGVLRFLAEYDVYSPMLDCLSGADASVYLYTTGYEEQVSYSINNFAKDFFCITGGQCSADLINKSITDYIFFTGANIEHEPQTIEILAPNTGLDHKYYTVRRLAKTGSIYNAGLESTSIEAFRAVQADNPFTPPPNPSQMLCISGGKTGYINEYIGTTDPTPYDIIYKGSVDVGAGETKIGEENIHSFVSVVSNCENTDAIGRDIRVISNFPGDLAQYWGSELKYQFTGNTSAGNTGDISEFDSVIFEPLDLLDSCDRLTVPILIDHANVDYNPVKFHVKNESDLPIFVDIGAYITKQNKGVVDAEGGTGAALFGNSGMYLFRDANVPAQELSSAPYSYKQIAKKAIISGNTSGSKFFLDPNAHFIKVQVNRLFPRGYRIGNEDFTPESDFSSETYIISRSGVPTYISDSIKVEHPVARFLEIKGFHPKDQRRDIEFAYKETKVLLESKTLTLNADIYTPHTGAIDTSISTAGTKGYGSTASGAEDDANDGYGNCGPGFERCLKTSWVPNLDIGKFDKLTKSLTSSETVENGPSDFTSTKNWALSGYINGFRNLNTNPSMYLTGVNFGQHTGSHFLIKSVGGYLTFSGKKDIPTVPNVGFAYSHLASGSELVATDNPSVDKGNFSSLLGAFIPCQTVANGKSYTTFNFNSKKQILIASRGGISGISSFLTEGEFFGSIFDDPIASTGSISEFTSATTSEQNDFYYTGPSVIPDSLYDYDGLYRSFNETEFYLKSGENKFSGIFIDLSGASIPPSGNLINEGGTVIWNDFDNFAHLLYQCNECPSAGPIATYAPTGANITIYRNYRGKDFYDVSAAHVTSGVALNEASGFNTIKDRVSGILVNNLGLTGIEEHYNFLETARSLVSSPSTVDYHAYIAKLLYTKDHKVIPDSNATFELYRIDHAPEVRVLGEESSFDNVRVVAPILGGRPECAAVNVFEEYNLRFVNFDMDFEPTSFDVKFYKNNTEVSGVVGTSFSTASNVSEFSEIRGTEFPCTDKITCTIYFTAATGGTTSLSKDLTVNIIGSLDGKPLMGLSPSSNLSLNMHPVSGVIEVVPF